MGEELLSNVGLAALALLERRMGAMARAVSPVAAEVRAIFDVHHGPRSSPLAFRLTVAHGEAVLAALTDVPAVFTLEEVMGVANAMRPSGQDDDPEMWEEAFRARLIAVRK
jgi:hypothetical protein